MERLFEQQFYLEQWEAARAWIAANAVALSLATLGQALVIGLTYLAARAAAPRMRRLFAGLGRGRFEPQFGRIGRALSPLALPILWLILLWLAVLVEAGAGLPFQVMKPAVSPSSEKGIAGFWLPG